MDTVSLTMPASRASWPGRVLTALVILPLALGTAGCDLFTGPEDGGPPAAIESLPRELTLEEERAISASADFGLELLSKVSQAAPDSNLFLSPISAHMSLGMALNGADGETFEAMRQALALDGASLESANTGYGDLIDLLRAVDPSVEFRTGNSVWLQRDFPFLASYEERVREAFDARVDTVDFADEAATLEAINSWVSEATAGKIDTLLEELRSDEIGFLVNAVYFLGDWRKNFDPAETEAEPFRLDDGSTESVQLMHRAGEYRYGEGANFQAADLPYGGDAFVMTVVLPDESVGLDEFVAGLDREKWSEVLAAVDGSEREIHVHLPKFELEYGRDLKGALRDMGMGIAFDGDEADFGRMVDLEAIAPDNVFLTRVEQKTFIRVDEEGTEAAAATGTGTGRTTAPPTLRLDGPFLFAIRERLSGALLFIGKFERPPGG